MKIAVLGASGPTGQQVVQLSLIAGHSVSALVRNPDGVTTKHQNLKVEKVDIMKADSMVEALRGCDAVISCLGTTKTLFAEITFYSESTKAILEAMKKAGVKRFVTVTSWCTKDEEGNLKMYQWFLKPLFIGTILADMGRMEDIITSDDDIDYTIVKPGFLKHLPLSEAEVIAVEGAQFVPDAPLAIPRANVAKFMLDSLSTEKWVKKVVAIGMK